MLVLQRNGRKQKFKIRIQSWEYYAMVMQSYKVVYSDKIYAAVKVKVTFEIKSNI